MRSLKELSLRISNISSVQKTTKIMQMVAAAKLSQDQRKLSNSKLYMSKLHSAISLLVSGVVNQELLTKVSKTSEDYPHLIFIIVSDRGLCGNFNSSIIKFSQQHINKLIENGRRVEFVFWGKKASDISQNESKSKRILKIENIKGITLGHIESLIENIDLDRFSRIEVFYNKFCNTITQKPTLQTIKPWYKDSSLIDSSLADSTASYSYEHEPQNTEFILRSLLQSYIAAALYSSLLESAASENSARMVAMESANRNTKEVLNKLALLYNRSRQAAITTDLIEIIAGAESL